jgi:hypothetical protein
MERVFANLYRVDGRNSRGVSHTYFLKRKSGNALVSHQAPLGAADLDDIEAMGGLDSQWVCHSHDLMKREIHQALCDRFGANLHYHKVDRPRVRKKTKCPSVEYEGDGTRHGDDFEAHFLPTCTAGHSIYRWKCRGKYYLFTSHAIYYRSGHWELGFNETHRETWATQLANLGRLQAEGQALARPAGDRLTRTGEGLSLDSDPTGPAWSGVPSLRLTSRDGEPATYRTTARMAWNSSDLFVAMVNHEPEMDKLTVLADAVAPDRSAVWQDDIIDILICPDAGDRRRLHQIIVDAKGVALCGHCERGFKPAWGDPVQSRVVATRDRWTAIVKIPFADLGIARPVRGRTIALNLYRNRRCGKSSPVFSCWSVPGGRPRLGRERFGRVTFGG